MHKKQVQKIILFFFTINILLVCVYGVLFFSIQRKNQQTTEIYSSLYKKESEKGSLSFTQKSLDDTAIERNILESYFVSSSQAVAFIEQVEKLGGYSNTKVKLLAVNPPKRVGESFLLDFTADGKFADVYRLFALIDEMPYRLTVRTAVLSKVEKEETVGQWKGSFTVALESYIVK